MQGNDLASDQDCLKSLTEYIHDLLNHPCPPEDPDEPPSQATNSENGPETQIDPVTAAEAQTSLNLMKNGKAPGICSITTKQLKCGGDSLVESLVHIINHAWMQG